MGSDSTSTAPALDNHSDRAKLRKQRLKVLEFQQRLEDQEALKMTEAQRLTLVRSFQSVKTEFSDLDGLSWPQGCFRRRVCSTRSKVQDDRPVSQPFAVLSNADLASFSPDDTIRVSRGRAHFGIRPSSPTEESFLDFGLKPVMTTPSIHTHIQSDAGHPPSEQGPVGKSSISPPIADCCMSFEAPRTSYTGIERKKPGGPRTNVK